MKLSRWCAAVVVLGALAGAPASAASQELADFDYENLSFRGFGFEWGRIFPTRLENASSYTVRMDLGYLGPGLRILPSVSYWTAPFKRSEVAELEDRVASLVATQVGAPLPDVDLGTIEWSDVSLGLDAQVVWEVPFDVLTFAGAGVAAHLLNGDGAAINGTFVEDLLDSVTAGFNLHAGLEYPLKDRLRLTGQGRYEVLGDLQYFQLRFGAHLVTGTLLPGEERRR
jgi:hypothetical protein